MIALLIGIGVLILIALIVAGVNGTEDALAQRALNQKIGEAAETAAGKLDGSMGNDLGTAGISARMSGLTEFLHSLSTVTESGHRSGLPALALLMAGLLAIGGGVAVVVDRVEDRREFEACVEGATAVASAVPATSTTEPDPANPTTTTALSATGAPGDAAMPEDAGAPLPDAAPDNEDADEPTAGSEAPGSNVEPVDPDLGSFLTSCLNKAGNVSPMPQKDQHGSGEDD